MFFVQQFIAFFFINLINRYNQNDWWHLHAVVKVGWLCHTWLGLEVQKPFSHKEAYSITVLEMNNFVPGKLSQKCDK